MAFLAAAAPVLGVVLPLLGAGIQAAGSMQQGQYSAQVARNNKIVSDNNATYAKQAGAEEAIHERLEGAQRMGHIKSAQAGSGVDVASKSFKRVVASQQALDEADVETILHNADLTAYGYTTQGKNFESQAKQDEAAGWWGAAGSLAEGASSVASNWKPGSAPPPPNSWAPPPDQWRTKRLGYG